MKATGYAYYLRVRVKPEKRSTFIELILQLRDDTFRQIAGVSFYELLATADTNEFVIMQGFADQATYQRYADAPFHLEMAPHGWACLDGQPHIEALLPVSAP